MKIRTTLCMLLLVIIQLSAQETPVVSQISSKMKQQEMSWNKHCAGHGLCAGATAANVNAVATAPARATAEGDEAAAVSVAARH